MVDSLDSELTVRRATVPFLSISDDCGAVSNALLPFAAMGPLIMGHNMRSVSSDILVTVQMVLGADTSLDAGSYSGGPGGVGWLRQ